MCCACRYARFWQAEAGGEICCAQTLMGSVRMLCALAHGLGCGLRRDHMRLGWVSGFQGFCFDRYGGAWREAEAEKNLLRTHTTAVSTRMLYVLAARGFRPARLFSIDRVFRNEAVDRTHLAEFNQIEGAPLAVIQRAVHHCADGCACAQTLGAAAAAALHPGCRAAGWRCRAGDQERCCGAQG